MDAKKPGGKRPVPGGALTVALGRDLNGSCADSETGLGYLPFM